MQLSPLMSTTNVKTDKKCTCHVTDLMNYQYFVQIVPTEVHTLAGKWQTYQYSVKELARDIGETGGSMPGLFFKYDLSALKVIVSQDREPLWQFLVKLCAGVGGIVATSQLLSSLLHFAVCKVVRKPPETSQNKTNS